MNQYVRVPLALFRARVMFVVISLFMLYPGAMLLDKWWGMYVFSGCVLMFYLPLVYSEAFQAAVKDNKSYSTTQPYPLKGLVFGVIAEIPTLLLLDLLLFSYFFDFQSLWANILYVCYIFPFFGFLGLEVNGILALNYLPVGYYTCMLFVPCVCLVGYLAGCKNFTVMDKVLPKIIYKQSRK